MDRFSVWVGNYGTYRIPENLLDGVRLTKRGRPDKRSPRLYARFMDWVEAQEAAAIAEYANDSNTP